MRGPEEASSKGGCARVYVLAQRPEVVLRALRAHARAEAESGAGVPGQSRAMERFADGCEGPAEEAEPQVAAWSGDSGNVSQSHSSASVPWEDEGPESGAPSRDLPLLRRAAAGYAACLLPGAGARPEVEELDASLEDLLTRVDEFVGMLDMLRGDSSHVVSEGVPCIYAKATEMRRVYSKIDRLEAFVGMIGASVARLEEQVSRAEDELGTFPSTFRKLLRTINVPSFFNKAPSSRSQGTSYEPPAVFRTEDHFPCCSERPQV
ncbi:biogenesis of lysosome-related organelles complex 1 subunit 4 [Kogia breviceps]|uniref:biogenesis of lysosome-related organelles complex 1 subunit 4 n=1 Tax=Kogia breviceps TaxID=27615 RepID=UPI002795F0C2|nr:biogenesis of lysosome-related organelles complex 1 subunit 4 [Kogia breviceps]